MRHIAGDNYKVLSMTRLKISCKFDLLVCNTVVPLPRSGYDPRSSIIQVHIIDIYILSQLSPVKIRDGK